VTREYNNLIKHIEETTQFYFQNAVIALPRHTFCFNLTWPSPELKSSKICSYQFRDSIFNMHSASI